MLNCLTYCTVHVIELSKMLKTWALLPANRLFVVLQCSLNPSYTPCPFKIFISTQDLTKFPRLASNLAILLPQPYRHAQNL